MSGTRKPHHSGSFNRLARLMNAAAAADPGTTCWRDGLTQAEHPPERNRRWTCGHVTDIATYARHPSPYATYIDGRLCAPEIGGCNYSSGATDGNRQRQPPTERWW